MVPTNKFFAALPAANPSIVPQLLSIYIYIPDSFPVFSYTIHTNIIYSCFQYFAIYGKKHIQQANVAFPLLPANVHDFENFVVHCLLCDVELYKRLYRYIEVYSGTGILWLPVYLLLYKVA